MPNHNLTIYSPPMRLGAIMILTGQRFGRYLVFGFAGCRKGAAMWHALCDCGNTRTVASNSLRMHKSISCGCTRENINIRHGHTINGEESSTYKSFHMARNRCSNPQYRGYINYGGRGIEFRFNSFEEFLQELGERPSLQHTIDRINNDGHYEKGNVRWATINEQMRNRRNNVYITAFGRSQCQEDWSGETGVPSNTIIYRLRSHWCAECAVTRPPHSHCPHHQTLSS